MNSGVGLMISLQTTHILHRKLRYITVRPDLQTVVNNGEMQMEVPLFLASDVLNGTAVSPDNQPRIHARYGKQGLATKLIFPPGAKVSGLHGVGRGVWFYSVLGAMKVTFEFHGIEQQVALMDSLQDVWRQRANDPLLPTSVTVLHVREYHKDSDRADLRGDGSEDKRTDKSDITEPTAPTDMKRNCPIVLGNDKVKSRKAIEDFHKADSTDIIKSVMPTKIRRSQTIVVGRNEPKSRVAKGHFQKADSTDITKLAVPTEMTRNCTIVIGNDVQKSRMMLHDFQRDNSMMVSKTGHESLKRSLNVELSDKRDPKRMRTEDTGREDGSLVTHNGECGNGNISELAVHHVEEISTDEEPAPPRHLLEKDTGGGSPLIPSSVGAAQTDSEFTSPRQTEHRCWCKRIAELSDNCTMDEQRNLLLFLDALGQRICSRLFDIPSHEIQTCVDLLDSILHEKWSWCDAANAPPSRGNLDDISSDEESTSNCRVTEAVADWLGTKFHSEVSAISKRVEDFKLKNIDQINSLPQPERLVHDLFPKAMVDFVMAWTGSESSWKRKDLITIKSKSVDIGSRSSPEDDPTDGVVEQSRTDGDGGSGSPLDATTGVHDKEVNACFPLVQFILELANQTLVSGMAHVIYPRLIQNAAM